MLNPAGSAGIARRIQCMPGSPIQPLPEPFFVTESGSPELLTRIRSEDVRMLYPVVFSIEEARHVLSVRRAPSTSD